MAMALRTESRMDRSDDRHSRLMPATWMIALKGSRPAVVKTVTLSGCGRYRSVQRPQKSLF